MNVGDTMRDFVSCNYAAGGTYGHECGSPALWAASHPSALTLSGLFWVRRCHKCRTLSGPENEGLSGFVPFDRERHENQF